MSHILVIGAGIGGMTAAARLAKMGHTVEIFEASHSVGGKCKTEWIGNFAFDTGPTLLTLPKIYKEFFAFTGAPIESVLTLEPVDPSFDYRFANGDAIKFGNLSRQATLDAIERSFGTSSAREWRSLMLRSQAMWDASRKPFIESELASIFSLLKEASLLKDLRTIAPWQSLRSLVENSTKDSRLQFIVDRYATYSGSDPRKAPAVLLSIAYIEEAFGAWHIQGGVGQLALAIKDRATELGVKFHLNASVSSIIHDGTKATGIELSDATIIQGDAIVANADATEVYRTLITQNLPILRKPRRSLAKADPSLSGFSLFLALKEDPSDSLINHHTILFPDDYDAEFDAIFTQRRPVEDPTIYICAPKDPQMRQNGEGEGWSILVNAPVHSENSSTGFDWTNADFAQSYANKILDSMESRGIPVRHRLESMKIRTPADVEKEVRAPGGSIYGTSSNGARSAFMRAKNRSPLNGLFCVGGSAHPGGGLPLVAISADIVARAIGKA